MSEAEIPAQGPVDVNVRPSAEPLDAAKKTRRDTCYCSAYEYPHRLGGGDCAAPYAITKDDPRQDCYECRHGIRMTDPYATGDSPTQYECLLQYCPWEGR